MKPRGGEEKPGYHLYLFREAGNEGTGGRKDLIPSFPFTLALFLRTIVL